MKKFKVNVSETSHGWVEVEAEDEQEATDKASEAIAGGMVNFMNSEEEIGEVKEITNTLNF